MKIENDEISVFQVILDARPCEDNLISSHYFICNVIHTEFNKRRALFPQIAGSLAFTM